MWEYFENPFVNDTSLDPRPLPSLHMRRRYSALSDALCFTLYGDLEEGKISTILLNEFASFQENDSFSRLEYIFASFFLFYWSFLSQSKEVEVSVIISYAHNSWLISVLNYLWEKHQKPGQLIVHWKCMCAAQ